MYQLEILSKPGKISEGAFSELSVCAYAKFNRTRKETVMHDVVVVGGGPSGLNCAYMLSREGLNVLVLDDRPQIGRDRICTGIVGTEAFKRFDLSQDSIMNEIKTIRIVSPLDSLITYALPTILAYVVDRGRFDGHIADLAISHGTEIRLNSQVLAINVEKRQVEITVKTAGESLNTYSARVAILAIGMNLKFNKILGLGCPKNFLYGVNAHAKVEDIDTTTVYVGNSRAPGAFTWTTPLRDGLVRIGLMAEERPKFYFQKFCEEVIRRNKGSLEVESVGYKPIAQGLVSKTYGDRVIAVGEVAGQVKTTTGGGIYYGLLCSEIAAHVLLKAFRKNSFGASTLAEYEKLWKKAIGNEIRIGYYMRKMYARLTDWQIEEIFSIVKSDGILPFVTKRVKFDWHSDLLLSFIRMIPITKIFNIH